MTGEPGQAGKDACRLEGTSGALGLEQVLPGSAEPILAEEGRPDRVGCEFEPSLGRAVSLRHLPKLLTDLSDF